MVDAKAVKIRGKGGVEVLEWGEHLVRDPGPQELLIEVVAAGLNRADLLQRIGYYPAPPGSPPDVPGLEYAGRVAAAGPEVQGFAVGDPVMGIVAGGGMATHLVAHCSEVMPVPLDMTATEAAAIPEVFLTAYDALFAQGQLMLGQLVLIHAAGSGVGTAAIQLAHAAGAVVVGTARSQDKLDACAALGLTRGLCITDRAFGPAFREAMQGRLADLILDTVGAAYLKENIEVVAPLGTLVVIGLLGGATGELPLGLLLAKRARLIGTVLRSRTLAEKAKLTSTFVRDVLPLFSTGVLRPVVDRVMPVAKIRKAHEYMASNRSFGKVVITIGHEHKAPLTTAPTDNSF